MKAYLSLILTRGLSAVAQMVLVFILASAASASSFGLAIAVFSGMSVVAALSDFGLGTFTLRAAGRGDTDAAVGAAKLATRFGFVTASACSMVMLLLAADNVEVLALSPLAVWAVAERNTETRNMLLLAAGEVGKASFLIAGRRIISVPVMYGLIQIAPSTLAFSLALCLTSVCAWYLSLRWTHATTKGIPPAPWRLAWRVRAFGITGISGQFRNLDISLVGLFAGGAAAGVYGLGARLGAPLLIVYNAISNMMVAEAWRRNTKSVIRIEAWIWFLALVTAAAAPFLAYAFGPILSSFVPWLVPEDLYTVGALISLTSFVGLGVILSSSLVNVDEESFVAKNSVIWSLLSLLLIGAFALLYGTLAAACAGIFAYISKSIVLQLRLFDIRRTDR